MMATSKPDDLFKLENELLNDPTLTDRERLRWKIPKLKNKEAAMKL